MRTFETMKTPPTRKHVESRHRRDSRTNPVKSHTHVQQVARCLHVDR